MALQLNAYLFFDGRCAEAMAFYAECLGGEVALAVKYGDTPLAAEVPEEWQGRLCHAEVTVGEWRLMGCDSMPGQAKAMQGFGVSVNEIATPEEAERLFAALSAGADDAGEDGGFTMVPQKTFWARSFGACRDRFGVQWFLNCE